MKHYRDNIFKRLQHNKWVYVGNDGKFSWYDKDKWTCRVHTKTGLYRMFHK